jgi:hypothetical protein
MLASQVALMKSTMHGFMKEDKIREDIEKSRKAGLPVPAVAEDL